MNSFVFFFYLECDLYFRPVLFQGWGEASGRNQTHDLIHAKPMLLTLKYPSQPHILILVYLLYSISTVLSSLATLVLCKFETLYHL